jgi:4-oxalocrotonate tautomerase
MTDAVFAPPGSSIALPTSPTSVRSSSTVAALGLSAMPLIEVTLAEGRTPVQLRTLISALTDAAAEAVDAPVDSIRVVIREVPLTHWGAGDVTIAERRGAPDPRAGT